MAIPLQKINTRATGSNISDHRLPSPAPSDEGDPQKKDVERPVPTGLAPDPYSLRSAMKTGDELQALRNRSSRGKALEEYHKKQNEVGRRSSEHWTWGF